MRFATGLLLLVALAASASAAAAGSSSAVVRTAALAPISKEKILASKILQKAIASADASSLAADDTILPAAAAALRALGEKLDSKALCSAAASILKSSSASVSSLASAAEASKTAGCSSSSLPASAEPALSAALLSESFADVHAALTALANASPSAATAKAFPALYDAFSLIADLVMPDGSTRASATSIASSAARTGLAAQAVFPLVATLGSSAPASAARAIAALSSALPKTVSLAASQQPSLPDVAAVLVGLAAAPAAVIAEVDAASVSALAALVSASQDTRAPATTAAVASAATVLAAVPAAAAPVAVTVSRSIAADSGDVTVTVADIFGAPLPASSGAETAVTIKTADGTALATKQAVPASGRVAVPALASAPAGALRVGVTVSRPGASDVTVVRRSLKALAVSEGSASVFLSDKKMEADSSRASGSKGIAKLGAAFSKPLTLDAAAGGKYLRADVSLTTSAAATAAGNGVAPVATLRLVPKDHPSRPAVFPLPVRQGKYSGAYALLSPAVRAQLSGDGLYSAYVDVASAALAAPIAWELGSVTLAGLGAWTAPADATALPSPLFHTFDAPPSTPPAVISLTFAAAAMALLVGLVAAVTATVCPKAVGGLSGALKRAVPSVAAEVPGRWTVPFVATIGGALVLNVLYWTHLNLFQALIANAVVVGPALLLVGHRALSETHAKGALTMSAASAAPAVAAADDVVEDEEADGASGKKGGKKGASSATPAVAALASAVVEDKKAAEEKVAAAPEKKADEPQQQNQGQGQGQGKKNKNKKK